jgi:hypothetical protein
MKDPHGTLLVIVLLNLFRILVFRLTYELTVIIGVTSSKIDS